jgi:hypothetical protein
MVQRAKSGKGRKLKTLMNAVMRQVQPENLDSTVTEDKFILGLTEKKKYRKLLSRALQRNADLFPQVAIFFSVNFTKP